MRLTKGQLKRIIREEYSRLKRRGLIREMADNITVTFEDYETGGQYTCTVDPNLYSAIMSETDPDEQMLSLIHI